MASASSIGRVSQAAVLMDRRDGGCQITMGPGSRLVRPVSAPRYRVIMIIKISFQQRTTRPRA